MSDMMSHREWHFYIDDMLGFCTRVQTFTAGLDQAGFVADALRFDATLRNLELIGEANDTLWSIVETDVPALLGNRQALKAKGEP